MRDSRSRDILSVSLLHVHWMSDEISLVRKRMNRIIINEATVFKEAVSKKHCSKKWKFVSTIFIWATLVLPQCHKDRHGKEERIIKEKSVLKNQCLVTFSEVKKADMFCTFIYMNQHRCCWWGKKIKFSNLYCIISRKRINFSWIFVCVSIKEFGTFCNSKHCLFTVGISIMSITVALICTIWTVSFYFEKFIKYQVFAFCSSFKKSGS